MTTITRADRLPASLSASFASVIGAIPGCSIIRRISLVDRSGRKDPRPLVSVDVAGWSPTLHKIDMDWQTVLPESWTHDAIAADPQGMARHLERSFSSRIAMQRQRAEAGVALNEPFPLQRERHDAIRISHLHVDRGAMALNLAARSPSSISTVANTLRDVLKSVHHNAAKYRGTAVLDNNGGRAEERDADGKVRRVLRVQAWCWKETIISGTHLQILGSALPDQMVAALPGRTLGEAVEVHPVLAGRRIIAAGASMAFDMPVMWFDLEPDDVAVSELLSIRGGDEAVLEHLTQTAAKEDRP